MIVNPSFNWDGPLVYKSANDVLYNVRVIHQTGEDTCVELSNVFGHVSLQLADTYTGRVKNLGGYIESNGLDWTKPLKTRDGTRTATLLHVLSKQSASKYPYIVLLRGVDGEEEVEGYTSAGVYFLTSGKGHPSDLVNVKEP